MIIDTTGRYGGRLSRDVSSKTSEEFEYYYYLYEYMDGITVIGDNPQYPSLLNYVKAGMVTEDEMLEALQHK